MARRKSVIPLELDEWMNETDGIVLVYRQALFRSVIIKYILISCHEFWIFIILKKCVWKKDDDVWLL